MKNQPVVYLSAPGRDTLAVSQKVREMLEARDCEVLFQPPAPTTRYLTRGYCRMQRRPLLQKCDVVLELVGREAGPLLQRDDDHEDGCSLAFWEGQEAAHIHKPITRVVLADELLGAPQGDKPPLPEGLRYQAQYRRRLQKAPHAGSEAELAAILDHLVAQLSSVFHPTPAAPAVETVRSAEPEIEPGESASPATPAAPAAQEESAVPLAPPLAGPTDFIVESPAPSQSEMHGESEPTAALSHSAEIPSPAPPPSPHGEVAPLAESPAVSLVVEPKAEVHSEIVAKCAPVESLPHALEVKVFPQPEASPLVEAPQESVEIFSDAPDVSVVAFEETEPAPPAVAELTTVAVEEVELRPADVEESLPPVSDRLTPAAEEPPPTPRPASPSPIKRRKRVAVCLKRSRSASPMKVEFAFFSHVSGAELHLRGKRLDITPWKRCLPEEHRSASVPAPVTEALEPVPPQQEISVPKLEAPTPEPAPVRPAATPVSAPIEEQLLWPAEQAAPDEAAPAAASASAHYAEHMVWPSTLPDRDGLTSHATEAEYAAEEDDDDDHGPNIPSRVYVQLSMTFGAVLVAAILAVVSLWQTIHHRRAHVPVVESRLAQAETVAPTSSPAPLALPSSALPERSHVVAATAASTTTIALPAPAPSVPIDPAQRQQEVEQGLTEVIGTLRQQIGSGGPNLTGAHAKLFLAIQLDLDQALRQLSGDRERGNPKLFQVSRDLATTRLLAAEYPAARNCLLDLRDLTLQVHGDTHAETLLTDYFLAMTDLAEGLNHHDDTLIDKAEATLRSALNRLKLSARVSNKGRDAFEAALQCCKDARASQGASPHLTQWVWQRFPMTTSESEALLTSLQWGLQTQN